MNYIVPSKSEGREEPQTAMQLCESLRQLSRVLQGKVWSTVAHWTTQVNCGSTNGWIFSILKTIDIELQYRKIQHCKYIFFFV